MSKYFNRTIQVLTGVRGSETALSLTGSRVEFMVKKTNKRTNNSAQIRIYNLSNATVAEFEKKNAIATLNAGYEQGLGAGTLISGDISDIKTERNGGDIATVLDLSDGTNIIREKTVSVAMSGSVTVQNALKKIADNIGLPLNISEPITAKYQSGFACYGAPMDAIDKICRKIKYLYSVENGVLNLWPANGVKKTSVINLSPSTGLIGRPEKITIDKKNGWSIKGLLSPSVVVGGRVQVASETVSGVLKINNLIHTGDTHGGEWITTMEGFIG